MLNLTRDVKGVFKYQYFDVLNKNKYRDIFIFSISQRWADGHTTRLLTEMLRYNITVADENQRRSLCRCSACHCFKTLYLNIAVNGTNCAAKSKSGRKLTKIPIDILIFLYPCRMYNIFSQKFAM